MGTLEVKICGLTAEADVVAACEAGADYLGFVLYPPSVRAVSVVRLAELVAAAGAGARTVGVFVNEPPERVRQVAADCGLYAVQLHGDERPEAYAGVAAHVWRAVRVQGDVCQPDPALWAAERVIVDALVPGRYGGAGVTADWEAAARLARRYAVLLAGGLTPENVSEAVRRVGPRGVDVAGGVEQAPGRKDHEKIRRFIAAARQAAAAA